MKILKYTIGLFFFFGAFVACEDEDNFDFLDTADGPTNISALFQVTPDNSGLVTITPNGDGATTFKVFFEDGSNQWADLKLGESVEHTYSEGTYPVKIEATGIAGKKTTVIKDLVVSFRAPENLEISAEIDSANPFQVNVSATADFAASFEVFFDTSNLDEEATLLGLGETVSFEYPGVGDYTIKVIGLSGGAETVEATVDISIVVPTELPIDFEAFDASSFIGFGGVGTEVIDNPDTNGNTSSKVGKMVKGGPEPWAGAVIITSAPIDFSSKKRITLDVWSPRAGGKLLFKLENLDNGGLFIEKEVTLQGTSAWEEVSIDFDDIDTAITYQKLVMFFDFGTVGDGTDEWTFFVDNIRQELIPTGASGIAGTWRMAPEAGSLGVGPAPGDISWFSCDAACVAERACYYDDTYVFGADGSFNNVLGSETWIEGWQGGGDTCGTPVAPHDGSTTGTYVYDEGAGTVTINGVGSYIGLPKAINTGEISNPADAPASIIYQVSFIDNDTMSVLIEAGTGVYWQYKLVRDVPPIAGTWKLAPEAFALKVGPAPESGEWWSSSEADVTTRACYFDDEYVFSGDGTFSNVLGSDTWLESWQGVAGDQCAAPAAPHDGSAAATYAYDEASGKVTLTGTGAYLGLPKANNAGELPNVPVPDTITYDVILSENDTVMTVIIEAGSGVFWTYKLVK